jgi:circadian clock protein KaiC
MTEHGGVPASVRVSTGVGGLDDIARGGLWKGGIYIVAGRPGTGKTVFANQMAFHHVREGGRVVYVTLLAETHARMLAQVATMSFFDAAAVGTTIQYLNAFSAIEAEGLPGLLQLVRRAVRDHRADLLVLDGMMTAGMMAPSKVDYKKFINELQTWVGIVGCTVLFLTGSLQGPESEPEHTMVDGVVELDTVFSHMRAIRQLRFAKLRGTAFTEGNHHYSITEQGLCVYPRFEAHVRPHIKEPVGTEMRSLGVARLDELLGGGIREGSITLVLGSSGSGKTTIGLQFLAAGARRGDPGLHFGFYETPGAIIAKGDRFGLDFSRLRERGLLHFVWQSPAETVLDDVAAHLLESIEKSKTRCLFIDGLVGFKEAPYLERLPGFFSTLSKQLTSMDVTTVITEETRELFSWNIEIPTEGLSAIFENIIFLRHVQTGSELERLITAMKTRDARHDRSLCSFEIRDDGIHIGRRFGPDDTAITGAAYPTAAAPDTPRKEPRRKR